MRRCLTIATILMTWSAAAAAQQLAPAKPPSLQKAEREAPYEAVLEVSRAKGLFDALLAKGGPTCVINSIACGETVTGTLTDTDCPLDDGTFLDFWDFQGTSGETVTINMTSNEFDTFLFLLDPIPVVVAVDDDGGSGTNSRIVFTLDVTGTWSIAANNFAVGDLGRYTLSLECSGSEPTGPAAPSKLRANACAGGILLDWQDNSDDENVFRVEVSTNGGSFEDIGSVPANTTEVLVESLQPATRYDFRVRARNSGGNSTYSDPAGAVALGPDEPTCTPGVNNLCLNDDRFKVEVDWRNAADVVGRANVVPFGSDDSGLFWFFAPDNWEMLVKMVDACNSPFDSFWVFSAATTDVEYTLRVVDTQACSLSKYFNPLGNAADAITDTSAFATCP